ncbi:MAG: two-component system sensor histidine kinase NtrB [Gemmatimonadaceae bacterium]
MLRDRLQYFRLLTLLLALVALWGVAATFGIDPASPREMILTIGSALLLSLIWAQGMRRRSYNGWWLSAEAVLFLGYAYGVGYGPFGVMYVALQHRALFGTRRETVVVAFTYAAALVFGHLTLGGPRGFAREIIVVELVCGAFGAYLMHTLAEVLDRDQARKRALRDSEQRFRSVIENLREALIITDLEDRITLVNQRVRDVLGYAPEELVGRPVTDLVADGVMRAAFRERLERRKQGTSELYDADLLHKDGHVISAEISAAPYRDATGVIVGSQGAITDVSSRKQMEERLRQASRMEAIGQLAGGVAHDFNNLLTVIKVHTELLLGDLGSTDPNRVSIVEIERSADRAASLTQQLLAFSRKQLLQPRLIRLEDVVARCESNLRSLIDGGVSLTMRHNETNFTVFADPDQVEQILVALVRNANDAVAAATDRRIDVRTAPTLLRELSSEPAHDIPPGQYMTLAVTDTGKGFSPDVAAHLFEPFVTTKAPGEGSGLGLASVYGAVRQGGGFIAVDSAPGAGSTFWIYFPIARRATPIDRASHRALVA